MKLYHCKRENVGRVQYTHTCVCVCAMKNEKKIQQEDTMYFPD